MGRALWSYWIAGTKRYLYIDVKNEYFTRTLRLSSGYSDTKVGLWMDSILILIVTFLLGASLATNVWFARSKRAKQNKTSAPNENDQGRTNSEEKPDEEGEEEPGALSSEVSDTRLGTLYSLAKKLDEFADRYAHPRDLLENSHFQEGVDLLSHTDFKAEQLVTYSSGDNNIIASMALEALNRREDGREYTETLINSLSLISFQPFFYALRALRAKDSSSLIGAVLANINGYWDDDPLFYSMLRDFCLERLAEGEIPAWDGWLYRRKEVPAESIEAVFTALDMAELAPLKAEFTEWKRTKVDVQILDSIGSVWPQRTSEEAIIEHPSLRRVFRDIESALLSDQKQSVLLIGKAGVGKTTIYTVVAKSFQTKGWTIFEAGATDIIAGQIYVGALEARIQRLMANLAGNRKALWIIPNLHELMYAGWHRDDPRSVLDMLIPYMESGNLTIIGETEPEAYERLLQYKPLIRSIMKGILVEPLDDEETLALAREWNRVDNRLTETALIHGHVIEEAFFLARQFLDKTAAPGNLLNLLKWTQRNLLKPENSMAANDVLHSLTQLTGLPSSILDQRQELNLGALRALFLQRVLGQPEAVDCLVERVAMIKAGLNDPSKPAGVFSFCGTDWDR